MHQLEHFIHTVPANRLVQVLIIIVLAFTRTAPASMIIAQKSLRTSRYILHAASFTHEQTNLDLIFFQTCSSDATSTADELRPKSIVGRIAY